MILLNISLRLPPPYYIPEPSASLVAATWIRVVTNACVRPLVQNTRLYYAGRIGPDCQLILGLDL
jgi:hypothetical protein